MKRLYLLLLLPSLAIPAPYRLYKCVGGSGETVYSDRHTGTECHEIWLGPQGPSTTPLITPPNVFTAKEPVK